MAAPDADRVRAVAVLRRLLDLTRTDSLDWRKRGRRPYAYEVDLPSGNVEIGTADDDGAAPYDLSIYSAGPELELVFVLSGGIDDEDVFEELSELWRRVARKVSGVDSTLDGLLKDLGG